MTKAKTGWLLLGILCLASFGVARDTAWEKYMKAGTEAYGRRQYAQAEPLLKRALAIAEKALAGIRLAAGPLLGRGRRDQ